MTQPDSLRCQSNLPADGARDLHSIDATAENTGIERPLGIPLRSFDSSQRTLHPPRSPPPNTDSNRRRYRETKSTAISPQQGSFRKEEDLVDTPPPTELHDDFYKHAAWQNEQTSFITPLKSLWGLMSKAPLLLRSSPGFGTGSYGAAPIGASTENSDEDDIEEIRRRNLRRKKSSGLKHALSTGTLSSNQGTSDSDISRRRSRREASRSKRRKSSAKSEDIPVDPVEDVGLGSRYSAGGIPIPTTKDSYDGAPFNDSEESYSDGGSEEAVTDDLPFDEEDPPDNSPYAQVRASVSAIDNTTLSINTPRMWTLSIIFAILGSSTNLFFSLRYPSVSITPVIALLLVHPLGLLWDRILKRRDDPQEEFVDGLRSTRPSDDEMSGNDTQNNINSNSARPGITRRFRLWLCQGRWNEKEHSCVYISSNISFGFAFATDVIVEQTKFYNQDVSITYQLLLILSTQILGYTFAGLCRRFLVRPGGMIWPGTLMSAAMFTTLHKEENRIANGWKMTRWRFFFIVWISAFAFYFLPGLLFPALSYFSVITWIWPKSVVVANLFGVASGLGLFPVTFDWAQIAYIGSPLLTPFWAAMNVVGGLVIVMWIIAPIAYYYNVFYSSYMPILSSSVFDNTGSIYDVSKILTKDFVFDKEAYHNYSRVYLPITYVLSYGLQFAGLASLLTHTACWNGKDIWKQWKTSMKEVEGESKATYRPIATNGDTAQSVNRMRRRSRSDSGMDNLMGQEDVHNRLMRRYKDAPIWWYLVTFVSMTGVGMFVVE
jgi:OPT family oligopeptide transporter